MGGTQTAEFLVLESEGAFDEAYLFGKFEESSGLKILKLDFSSETLKFLKELGLKFSGGFTPRFVGGISITYTKSLKLTFLFVLVFLIFGTFELIRS